MDWNNFIENFCHYGDILAIPFFALLVFYFYTLKQKSILEYVLLLFSISGFILDIVYTYIFFCPIRPPVIPAVFRHIKQRENSPESDS